MTGLYRRLDFSLKHLRNLGPAAFAFLSVEVDNHFQHPTQIKSTGTS